MKIAAYVVCVLMLAVVVSGCGFMTEKHQDPVTGKTVTTLSTPGEAIVQGGTTAVKILAGPLGIPPGVWDTIVALGLGALGIETTRRVANKIKKSKPGNLIG